MKNKKYTEKLEQQKKKIEFKLKQIGDKNKQEMLVLKIILDVINLENEILPDINMYKLTMEDYNNPILYQGHYYLYYSVLKLNMIMERIVNFCGIMYQTYYFDDNEKNTIKQIRNNLKDKEKTNRYKQYMNSKIKERIDTVIGNEDWRIIKKFRDINEHGISAHLDEDLEEMKIYELENDERIKRYPNIFSNINEEVSVDIYINSQIENIINFNKNKKFECKVIKAIENNYIRIINIVDDMINIFENETMDYSVNKNLMNLYIWNFNKHKINERIKRLKKNNVILPVVADKLLIKSFKIKDDVRKRFDVINKKFSPEQSMSVNKYEVYISDVSFRLSEYIRNICNIFALMNGYRLYDNKEKNICDLITVEYFYYAVILKLSSCYEKIGKCLYIMLDIEKNNGDKKKLKKKYFKKVVEMAIDEKKDSINAIKIARTIINKTEYKKYTKLRNKMYHGIRENIIFNEEQRKLFLLNNLDIVLECCKDLLKLLESINMLVKEHIDELLS